MLMWRCACCLPFRIAGLVVLVVALAGAGRAAQPAVGERCVVLISLDGFAAENLDDPRIPLPNLRRLAREGARAARMTVANPSVTWPNHTTLVTGVPAARHGVLANGRIEPAGTPPRLAVVPARSKAQLCQAPTIYDRAHAAGMETAAVNWPVTRGAPTLTWDFPDHPEPVRYTTPALLQELQAAAVLPQPTDAAFGSAGPLVRDQAWTDTAAILIRRHRPRLLLLHLLMTDATQHQRGPGSFEAFGALALADRQVGDVLQAVTDSGMANRIAVIVAADHGFARTTRSTNPNVRLRAAGLIRAPAPDRVEYDAQALAEGGVAFVYVPARREKPELVTRAREALATLEGVERVIGPEEFASLGLPLPDGSPQAPDLLLAAKDGYSFGTATTGDEVTVFSEPRGAHGYLASNPKMDALFLAAGAGIRPGARLERIRNLDVAPTIARLLGISMPDVEGQPLTAILQLGA
jgi:predicted AlkP superfamily pyrophosphatase or phosphodiesterase